MDDNRHGLDVYHDSFAGNDYESGCSSRIDWIDLSGTQASSVALLTVVLGPQRLEVCVVTSLGVFNEIIEIEGYEGQNMVDVPFLRSSPTTCLQ